MAFDLMTARVRIGLEQTDTSRDNELTIAMNAALSEAQRYCNRLFAFAHEEVSFIHVAADTVQLFRLPVKRVFSIKADGNEISADQYHLQSYSGQLLFDYRIRAHNLTVDYEGGYVQIPSDIELALWIMFDGAWGVIDTSNGSGSNGMGAIKTVSVPDVGSITYSEAQSKASAEGGFMSPVARSILDLYRLHVC